MEFRALCIHFLTASLLLVPAVTAEDSGSSDRSQELQIRETGEVEKAESAGPKGKRVFEGTMTLDQMGTIIKRIDENAQNPKPGLWRFSVENRPVVVLSDDTHNRMKILVPIGEEKDLTRDALKRLMSANFDSALDARYAIGEGVIWASYIHPLRELHNRQFISAIGQTVNLAITFGSTYSSGAFDFQEDGSESGPRRKLIEDLLEKGLPT